MSHSMAMTNMPMIFAMPEAMEFGTAVIDALHDENEFMTLCVRRFANAITHAVLSASAGVTAEEKIMRCEVYHPKIKVPVITINPFQSCLNKTRDVTTNPPDGIQSASKTTGCRSISNGVVRRTGRVILRE